MNGDVSKRVGRENGSRDENRRKTWNENRQGRLGQGEELI